jgi:hypothetical protein
MLGLEVVSFIFGAILLTIALLGGVIDISVLKVGTTGPVTTQTRIITGLLGTLFIGLGFWSNSRPVDENIVPNPTQAVIVPTLTSEPTSIIIDTPTPTVEPTFTPSPPTPTVETFTPSPPTPTSQELYDVASTQWSRIILDIFNENTNGWVEGEQTLKDGKDIATIRGCKIIR